MKMVVVEIMPQVRACDLERSDSAQRQWQHIPNPDANLLGIPTELRLQILGNLLPDVDFVPFRFSYKEAKKLEDAKPVAKPACTACGHWPKPRHSSRLPWREYLIINNYNAY